MIEVRNVSYTYPGQRNAAVEDVTLNARSGEVVGVIGPNGSGKSTLGQLIKGLLLPSAGSIVVDGIDSRSSALSIRRLVGLVFQNPNSQIVNAVVDHEVAFGLENQGLPAGEIRRRVDTGLIDVGLDGEAASQTHLLSLAGKQRVALASVIVMQPRYLILDEATAWLEPQTRWALLRRVLALASEADMGLILITHRMEEAQFCHRVYGMLDGRIEIEGAPTDVLENEQARRRLSLELPESFSLGAKLKSEGLPVVPGDPVDRLADELCQS